MFDFVIGLNPSNSCMNLLEKAPRPFDKHNWSNGFLFSKDVFHFTEHIDVEISEDKESIASDMARVCLCKDSLCSDLNSAGLTIALLCGLFFSGLLARKGTMRLVSSLRLPGLGGRVSRPKNLHEACRIGSLKDVKIYLAQDDVNRVDDDEKSPLMHAVANGHAEVALHLLDQGACTDIFDEKKRTPLHVAIKKGYEGIAFSLVSRGAPINAKDSGGISPLMLASWKGSQRLLEEMLKGDIDLNEVDKSGKNALHYAAQAESYPNIRLLVDKGFDPQKTDRAGLTPLEILCGAEEMSLEDFTAQYFSDSFPSQDDKRRDLQKAYAKLRPSVKKLIEEKMAAALSESEIDRVRQNPLWSRDVSSRWRKKKFYPLGIALIALEKEHIQESFQVKGCIRILGGITSRGLFAAAAAKKVEVYQNLQDPNITDEEGTPLAIYALKKGNESLAMTCLNHSGFNFQARDLQGNTLAHAAVEMGSSNIVDKCDASLLNQENAEGKRPLEIAAFKGHQHLYGILTEKMEVDALNAQSRCCGLAPIEYAVALGSDSLKSYLNQKGVFFAFEAEDAKRFFPVQLRQFIEFFEGLRNQVGLQTTMLTLTLKDAIAFEKKELTKETGPLRQLRLAFSHLLEEEALLEDLTKEGEIHKNRSAYLFSSLVRQYNKESLGGEKWESVAPVFRYFNQEAPDEIKNLLQLKWPLDEYMNLAMSYNRLFVAGANAPFSFRQQVVDGSL